MRHAKPSVNYYRELLTKISAKPEECLMVGNSMRKDAPCLETGIPFFLYTGKRSPSQGEIAQGNYDDLKRIILERTLNV